MVVDAELSAVDCERAGLGAQDGYAIEAAIEIFGLERPARHEHPFQARARGAAGAGLGVAERYAERGGAALLVRRGKAGGAVKQNLIERYADTAAKGGQ